MAPAPDPAPAPAKVVAAPTPAPAPTPSPAAEPAKPTDPPAAAAAGGHKEATGKVVSIAGAKAKKPAVPFHHDFHKGKDGLGISCKTCHHAVDGAKVEKACTDCHKNDSVDLPTAEDAFHDTCRTCHKKQMAKDPTLKAPTSCKGCHAG